MRSVFLFIFGIDQLWTNFYTNSTQKVIFLFEVLLVSWWLVSSLSRRSMGFGWGGGAPSYNISWWQRSPILTKPQRVSAPAGLKPTAAK